MSCSRTFSCARKQLYEWTKNFLSETERTGGLLYIGTGEQLRRKFRDAKTFFRASAILRLRSERFGFSGRWTAHHQAGIANFVNHGAIADLQRLCGFAPVPMIGAQCFDNGV